MFVLGPGVQIVSQGLSEEIRGTNLLVATFQEAFLQGYGNADCQFWIEIVTDENGSKLVDRLSDQGCFDPFISGCGGSSA